MASRLRDRIGFAVSRVRRLTLSSRDRELLALGDYAERDLLPRNLPPDEPSSRFIPSTRFADFGLDFNIPGQLERLKRWGQDYQHLFGTLRADPSINVEFPGENYLHNRFYPTPDAEAYAAMILDVRPARIVEVGSGFSTLVAKKSIEFGGLRTTITAIDPSPRADVSGAADRVLLSCIEDVDVHEIGITQDDMLFIDSSHICRGRGDVPFLYCNIIPRLPSGTMVHVHDVFLPYDYPVVFLKRGYTEQYLLYSTLLHSDRYEIVFTAHYMSRTHPKDMQATFGPTVGVHNRFFGASLWFRVK